MQEREQNALKAGSATVQRILIIDDEPDFTAVLAEVCRQPGRQVVTCNSTGDARSLFPDYRPDLVLLDIVMPEQDGIEFLQWACRQNEASHFILMTGFNPHYMQMAEKLAGLSGVNIVTTLQKPIPIQKLRQTLADLDTARHARSGHAA